MEPEEEGDSAAFGDVASSLARPLLSSHILISLILSHIVTFFTANRLRSADETRQRETIEEKLSQRKE